jgi:hypothetical protein
MVVLRGSAAVHALAVRAQLIGRALFRRAVARDHRGLVIAATRTRIRAVIVAVVVPAVASTWAARSERDQKKRTRLSPHREATYCQRMALGKRKMNRTDMLHVMCNADRS